MTSVVRSTKLTARLCLGPILKCCKIVRKLAMRPLKAPTGSQSTLPATPDEVHLASDDNQVYHDWVITTKTNCIALRPPPSQFFWAVLGNLPRRVGAYALQSAFEAWLPLTIDNVEARFTKFDRSSAILACGVTYESLDQWIKQTESETNGDVVSVQPAGLPECLTSYLSNAQPISTLEFRSGAYEPASLQRNRRWLIRITMVAIAAISTLFTAGMLVSASRHRAIVLEADAATAMLTADVLAMGPLSSSVDPQRLLTLELNQLRDAKSGVAETYAPLATVEPLLALLGSWPSKFPTLVDHLEVDQSIIRLVGAVPTHEHAEEFMAAIESFSPAWSIKNRSVQAGHQPKDGIHMVLVLERGGGSSQP